LLKSVEAKRPKTVIDHILKHGQTTTEELKDTYGYNHPPKAIRGVREQGIPVKTFRVTGTDGGKIAAYKFGNPSEVRSTRLSERTAFPSNCHVPCDYIPRRSYPLLQAREVLRLLAEEGIEGSVKEVELRGDGD